MKKIISILISVAVLFALGGCNASTIEDVSSEASDQVASATSSESVSSEEVSHEVSSEETITSVPTSSKETPSSKPTSSKPKPTSSASPVSSEPIYSEDGTIEPGYMRTSAIQFNVADESGNPINGVYCKLLANPPQTIAEGELQDALKNESYYKKTENNGAALFMLNSYHDKQPFMGFVLSYGKAFSATITYLDGSVHEFASEESGGESPGWNIKTDGKMNIINVNYKDDSGNQLTPIKGTAVIDVVITWS